MALESEQVGLFIPTTDVWDIQQLFEGEITNEKLKLLLVRLYQNINLISLAVNLKDSGIYSNIEPFVNGQTWFPNPAYNSSTDTYPSPRQDYRLVINFGALPDTATKSVLHNIPINSGYTFTRIYGCATDTTGLTAIPIPFASPVLANNIQLDIDATNVNITTGSNRTNYNECYVIIEYLTN